MVAIGGGELWWTVANGDRGWRLMKKKKREEELVLIIKFVPEIRINFFFILDFTLNLFSGIIFFLIMFQNYSHNRKSKSDTIWHVSI